MEYANFLDIRGIFRIRHRWLKTATKQGKRWEFRKNYRGNLMPQVRRCLWTWFINLKEKHKTNMKNPMGFGGAAMRCYESKPCGTRYPFSSLVDGHPTEIDTRRLLPGIDRCYAAIRIHHIQCLFFCSYIQLSNASEECKTIFKKSWSNQCLA